MKPRKLIAPLTIFFIFLSGFFLQTINFLEVKIDAVSSATNRIMKAEAMTIFTEIPASARSK